MKADYILKWTTAAAGHLKQGANGNAAEIIEALKAEAAAEIRREEAKRSGTANRQKAAERVIKSARASMPFKEALHGAWITADGMQNLCDGFQAYRLREALPLEEIPANVQPLDIARIVLTNCGDVVPLPELSELRAYIKTEKARKKATKDKSGVIYDFGEELPQINAEYLLTALELLPNCTAYAKAKNHYIYFESEAGRGVILPIHKA